MDSAPSAPTQAEVSPTLLTWTSRVRLFAAAGLLWGVLHYGGGALNVGVGLDQPMVLFGGGGGLVLGLLVLLASVLGAYFGAYVGGFGRIAPGLSVVSLAIAAWAAAHGTMDDWLCRSLASSTGTPAPAYWPLLADYAVLLACMLAALVMSEWARLGARVRDPGARAVAWRLALGLSPRLSANTSIRTGLTALLVVMAVGAVGMLLLTGPRIGYTYRGQVYFAVALSLWAGTLAAIRVSRCTAAVWYLFAPFALGVVGVIAAASGLRLPPPYSHLNSIPVIGLVRPLPIEMFAVGTLAVLWALRHLPEPAIEGAASSPQVRA